MRCSTFFEVFDDNGSGTLSMDELRFGFPAYREDPTRYVVCRLMRQTNDLREDLLQMVQASENLAEFHRGGSNRLATAMQLRNGQNRRGQILSVDVPDDPGYPTTAKPGEAGDRPERTPEPVSEAGSDGGARAEPLLGEIVTGSTDVGGDAVGILSDKIAALAAQQEQFETNQNALLLKLESALAAIGDGDSGFSFAV
mmetsp:Transcript_38972/g.87455  ORF Transcript_38972/g.87455 Transcript_38972/m.87455 type:complete len:198 (+) Transcript_38972:537-1130(+)